MYTISNQKWISNKCAKIPNIRVHRTQITGIDCFYCSTTASRVVSDKHKRGFVALNLCTTDLYWLLIKLTITIIQSLVIRFRLILIDFTALAIFQSMVSRWTIINSGNEHKFYWHWPIYKTYSTNVAKVAALRFAKKKQTKQKYYDLIDKLINRLNGNGFLILFFFQSYVNWIWNWQCQMVFIKWKSTISFKSLYLI